MDLHDGLGFMKTGHGYSYSLYGENSSRDCAWMQILPMP